MPKTTHKENHFDGAVCHLVCCGNQPDCPCMQVKTPADLAEKQKGLSRIPKARP